MQIHVFTGSNDAIRDAMALDFAKAYARKSGSKVEDKTEALKADPELLVEVDASQSLFDDPNVLIFYGSADVLFKTLPKLDQDGDNLLVISATSFAASKVKGVNVETTALPPAKNTANLAKFYLESVPGFPAVAIGQVVSHVGKELNRLPLLVSSLRTHYGEDISGVSPQQVMELLGDPHAPAPWDLTDAVDRGDIPGSLRISRRLQEGKGSPYGVTVILSNHFGMMYRLAQAGIRNEREGAAMLGVKGSTYPVKKAIANARRYGPRLELMVRLVDTAQKDLKGASSLDAATTVDILVSRLAAH